MCLITSVNLTDQNGPNFSVSAGNNPSTSYYSSCSSIPSNSDIDIKPCLFEVKKRVLGVDASAVLAISNEVGGQTRSVRIRMRGIGSGYVEGPTQQELQEPLHFNVCAESEEISSRQAARVHELVNWAKLELEGHL